MTGSPVILHVDDDEGCLELLRSSFERALPRVEVVTRADPNEALATLSVEPVDVIVSDSIELANGTPFVEAARNAYPDAPIVLYTGREFTDAAPVIAQAGITEYVQKSADGGIRDLVGRVEQFVGEAASRTDTSRFRYTPSDDTVDSIGSIGSTDSTGSIGSTDSVGSRDLADEEWTELARCDPTSVDDLVVTLIDVLGDRADERPLVELFDPEALVRLFSRPGDGHDITLQLRIRLDTHEVVVTDSGVIASRPVTSA